jgi:radical SAM superfamily enzyme YgiQ (UPF0313 family)
MKKASLRSTLPDSGLKKKVVLVGGYLPGIYPPGQDDVVSTLLSVGFLKSAADADPEIAAQYDIEIVDAPTTIPPSEIAVRICAMQPDVLAYSCYMWNYDQVVGTLEVVKREFPDVKVIWGGPLVTYTPEDMLRANPGVDVIVCGSGESRFKQLLKSDFSLESLRGIPRIAFFEEDGQPVTTQGTVVEDLNQIPSPYQTGAIDLNDGRKHTAFIETYRGCPFECGYCIWGEPDKSLHQFPLDHVLRDIEIVYNHPNVEAVIFTDACLFYTRERAKIIVDKIAASSRGKIIPTVLTLDILVVNEEMVTSLSKINLVHNQLHFGLQTTNPDALELLKRKSGPDIFKKRVDQIRNINPEAEISFDLIYGLPGDNYEAFRESVDFTLGLNPGKLYFSPLLLLPGTPFWDQQEELGFDFDPQPPYMVRSNKHYSLEDMMLTSQWVLWLLSIMYIPAIRDTICKIAELKPQFRRIHLIDRYIEILRQKVDPVAEIELEFTIDANNKARRHVMDTISRPENSLHAYEAVYKLLKECDAEILAEDVLIGIDYYRSSLQGNDEAGKETISQKYDLEKIEYIKSSWVAA